MGEKSGKKQDDPFARLLGWRSRRNQLTSRDERRPFPQGRTVETRRDDEGREETVWLLEGYPHREDGPAIEHEHGRREWWVDGRKHRENGPAIEEPDGLKTWWKDGLPHREDGPVLEHPSGHKLWAVEGMVFTSEEEWRQALMNEASLSYPVVEVEGDLAVFTTFVLTLTGLAQSVDPRQRERLATKTRSTHRGSEGRPYWRFEAGSSARFEIETFDGRKVAGRLQAFCWGVDEDDEEDYGDFVGREAEDSFLSAFAVENPQAFFADTRIYEPGELAKDEDGGWMRFVADLPCSVEVLTRDGEREHGIVNAIAFRQS
jgi:hypothetical protein